MIKKIKTIHVTLTAQSLNVFLKSRLNSIESHKFEVIGYSSYDEYLSLFKESGFKVIGSRHMTRSFNILEDIKLFIESYKIFKKEKPIIVHTYGVKPGLYVRIAARLAGVPIVIHTLWGFLIKDDFSWLKKIPFILEEKIAAYFCDYIFSVNKGDLRLMQRYHFKELNQLGYLGNGTDIHHKFNPSTYDKEKIKSEKVKLGLNPESLVVGQIGRLTESKGYKEFFNAARIIKQKNPDVEVIVVGPFDNTKGFGIKANEIELLEKEGIIKYLGSKNHDEMPLMYAIIDIIVLMSHREGFPRSLVEAASMGKPIIATDINGCREAVEPGVNGFLVPMRDYQALANALDNLINDADLRTKMVKNSRRKAEKEFDEEHLVNNILYIYKRLLKEKTYTLN
jgi:glycosyltransferase involved in cell wall biosynthesis